ncbi:MAG TPA: ATP-binding protein [Gemmatimonadaceae bacterium]|nr:ATP-binding protein [Gemmatimonadaceae bacterium]
MKHPPDTPELVERRPVPTGPAVADALFEGILSIAADAIITVDEAQRILHFNQGAEQIFGWTAAEVVGQPLDVLLPARFRESHVHHVRSFGAGAETARRMGHRREVFGLRRNGEEFPAEASISKLTLPDGRTLYSAVLRDVTERKRAEDEQRFLAEASAVLAGSLEYEATLAAVPRLAVPRLGSWCALATVDPADATIHSVTAPHADAGRTPLLEELLRRYPLDWDSPWLAVDVLRTGRAELVPHVTDEWLEARVVDAGQHRLLRLVGVDSLLIVPLVAREQVLGALTLARDVSGGGRRFDEEDLGVARDLAGRAAFAIDNARLYRAAQRATAARDVVLGVVSHDLRNPLSAIAMCASTLRESLTAAVPGGRDLADAIYDSTEWMQRLIRDLLDVAAIDSGHLSLERSLEDIGAIVTRALELLESDAAERGIVLEASVAPGLPRVSVDAERILQVLANLVGNAVKFSQAGGTVRVSAQRMGADVHVAVTDTGPGIPPEHREQMFDLYWHARRTARRRGSGYGLAIARGIVDAHGGRIWVESELGVGSTFAFSIPMDQPEMSPSRSASFT